MPWVLLRAGHRCEWCAPPSLPTRRSVRIDERARVVGGGGGAAAQTAPGWCYVRCSSQESGERRVDGSETDGGRSIAEQRGLSGTEVEEGEEWSRFVIAMSVFVGG